MSQLLFKYKHLSSFILLVASFLVWFTPAVAQADPEEGILNWFPRSALTEEELTALPSFCHGAYRPADIQPFDDDRIEAEADYTELHLNGEAHFIGDVVLQQQDRVVSGDEAFWNPQTGQGRFLGSVQLNSPLLTLKGDHADVNDSTGYAEFQGAKFSFPTKHMRGQAGQISVQGTNHLELKQSYFTFCEPGNNDWDVATSTLRLNNETGMGSAWNTRLRVKEVPVFYFPFYYFPLDDRRLTGFLDPSISLTGKLQAKDIQTPFYLNLAPNYDATITPHYVQHHGTAIETQFRHLTSLLGEGEFNYAHLDKDDTLDVKRWFLNYKHQGAFGNGWSHRWVYNQVSDNEYLNDMSPTEATNRSTHLPRRGEILWNQKDWRFSLLAEEYQTIDDSILLENRPYSRLPQATLSYKPIVFNGWQFQQTIQATEFTRNDNANIHGSSVQLSNFDSLNGTRVLSDTSIAYPFVLPYAFLTPKVEYRYRHYQLKDLTLAGNIANDPSLYDIPEKGQNIDSARYSLDSGLYFDRHFDWLSHSYQQTFEPRAFWVYSPYVEDQHYLPNFDSANITVTYNSLFLGERFTGGDRLADLNQLSLGATTRFIREDGLEQFRLSMGQIFYFRDRDVQLDSKIYELNPAPITLPAYNDNATHVSSFMAETEWNPNRYWSLVNTVEWDPYRNFARQSRHSLRFGGQRNRMINLAFNEKRDWDLAQDKSTQELAQLDTGIFWSLSDRWAVFGRTLFDVKSYQSSEDKPAHDVLESLAGFEYQNCCWRFQLSYRETSLQENNSTHKDYSFLFSMQLKGLGTIGKKTDSLISDAIPGYLERVYHDF